MSSPQSHVANRSTRILVTGAAGFIGSRIVRSLLLEGFTVTAIVRSQESMRIERLRSFLARGESNVGSAAAAQSSGDSLRLITCDLHDRDAVARTIAEHPPVFCIHAAWNVSQENYRSDALNQWWVKSSLHF